MLTWRVCVPFTVPGDYKTVLWERKSVAHLARLIHTEHGRADDLGRILVEIVELDAGHCATDARRHRFARISHEVGNTEEFGSVEDIALDNRN